MARERVRVSSATRWRTAAWCGRIAVPGGAALYAPRTGRADRAGQARRGAKGWSGIALESRDGRGLADPLVGGQVPQAGGSDGDGRARWRRSAGDLLLLVGRPAGDGGRRAGPAAQRAGPPPGPDRRHGAGLRLGPRPPAVRVERRREAAGTPCITRSPCRCRRTLRCSTPIPARCAPPPTTSSATASS